MRNNEVYSDRSYWNERWEKSETGWDIGYPSPAITGYVSQYADKSAAILIPGCGNAYEAWFFVENGFTNVTLIDIAPKVVEDLRKKFSGNTSVKILCEDFFVHEGKYDLIVEQTFFCAIPVDRRKDYTEKASSLLNPGGKVIGVLFDRYFEQQGPPFGGSTDEYHSIFSPVFEIVKMEKCYNSIAPRKGTEVFINLHKKSI